MKKILVYLEGSGNKFKRVSYELITAARNLSKQFAVPFAGIVFNSNETQVETAKEYGLSEIYLVNGELFTKYSPSLYSKAIAEFIQSNGFDLIFFPANTYGKELAGRVSVLLNAGYVSDCIGIEEKSGSLLFRKPVYAGKAQILAKINTEIQVCSLRPNVFTAVAEPVDSININNASNSVDVNFAQEKLVDVVRNEGKLDVLEADIVVSGGRGIKGPENYHLIEELATVLGGAVGASRAVVDAGWRPHSEQVGQTGKTVSPNLYVACGISGAIQHLAGMSSSKYILAINKDKDAPIFKVADYGIVGDLFQVVPKLIEKIKKYKE